MTEPAPVRGLIANARMYSVAPGAADAWQRFFAWLSSASAVPLTVIDHAYPAPLEELWARPDLGVAFMCGYPFMKAAERPLPLAAPIPAHARYGGRAVYATDFVVRADSPFTTLADTFGGRLGYTVATSHSGFNAVRHHLLRYRSPRRAQLYRETVGPLDTPRRIVAALLDGTIDVGPLDSYAHDLLRHHDPAVAAALRTVETTVLAPAPLLVASRNCPPPLAARLTASLLEFGHDGEPASDLHRALCLSRFGRVHTEDYRILIDREREAEEAGYALPR